MPQKEKAKVEEKIKIVRMYESGGISLNQAAQQAGVGRTTIRRWIARYKAEGTAGFLPYEQNRVYPPALKHQAVKEYLSGSGSLTEISIKYKLRSDYQLRTWIPKTQ